MIKQVNDLDKILCLTLRGHKSIANWGAMIVC